MRLRSVYSFAAIPLPLANTLFSCIEDGIRIKLLFLGETLFRYIHNSMRTKETRQKGGAATGDRSDAFLNPISSKSSKLRLTALLLNKYQVYTL
ncbi:hypothetical protein HDV57DRAFT_498483 [Trichoderma longibrachiatum]